MLPILLATLLAALIIPIVRIIAIKGVRNRIGNPLLAVVLLPVAIVLYLVVLGALAFISPTVLYLISIPVISGLIYLVWRARPSYGRSRGMPPGSLALFPTGQWNDQRFYEKGFLRYGSIFKTSDLYRPAVCILGIAPIYEFLSVNSDGLKTPAFPFGKFIPGGFLRFAEPARHKETRQIFQAAFAPSIYLAQQKKFETLIQHELAGLSRVSLAATGGVRPGPFIDHALLIILIRLFLGMDANAPEFVPFGKMLDAVALRRLRDLSNHDVSAILDEMMAAIHSAAVTSNIPSFAAELERVRPGALSDRHLTFNLIFMLQVARFDLAGLLQWVVKMLADNPAWLEQVRRAPATADLPTRIVWETLRLQQSEFIIRQTTRDITFEGYIIPRGWFVRLCIHESHRLSDTFENPTLFDPDRFLNRRFTRSEYMPFGALTKTCLGVQLTLTLARMFVIALARDYAMHVTSDGSPENDGSHWQPSTRFRIQLPPHHAPVPAPRAENKIRTPNV